MDINFVCDELDYARKIKSGEIKTTFHGTVAKYFAKLAKYEADLKGEYVNVEEVLDEVIEFMKSIDKSFDELSYYDSMIKTIKRHTDKNSKIIKVDGVKITKNELNKIVKLNNKHLEILAFCILVYKKVINIKSKKEKVIIENEKEEDKKTRLKNENIRLRTFTKYSKEYYKKLTRDGRSVFKQNMAICRLKEANLVELPKLENWGDNQNIILKYIDLEEKDEDIEITINDMREIRLYYYKWRIENTGIDENSKEWKTKKIKQCEECGKLIEVTNNNHKHCKDCRKKLDNESKTFFRNRKRQG